MFPLKKILVALALAFTSPLALAPVASSQGTNVVVVDTAKVMRDSKAGKDIRTKIANIGTTMNNEIKPDSDKYQANNKAFADKFEGMDEAVITAMVNSDQALQKEYIGLLQQEQALVVSANVAARDLRYTQSVAWGEFNVALREVLKEVVAERGAQVIMERSSLVYADPAIDISADVIAKLDAKTPTINVVRQSPPEQPQAGQ